MCRDRFRHEPASVVTPLARAPFAQECPRATAQRCCATRQRSSATDRLLEWFGGAHTRQWSGSCETGMAFVALTKSSVPATTKHQMQPCLHPHSDDISKSVGACTYTEHFFEGRADRVPGSGVTRGGPAHRLERQESVCGLLCQDGLHSHSWRSGFAWRRLERGKLSTN